METVVSSMSGPELTGFVAAVLAITGGIALAATGIIVPLWMWTRLVEARTQLVRDLVAAGYSATEVERITRAALAGSKTTTKTITSSESQV